MNLGRHSWLMVVSIGVALIAGAAVWFLSRSDGPQSSPSAVTASFLDRWEAGDWLELEELVLPPTEVADEYERVAQALDLESADLEAGSVRQEGDRARSAFTAEFTLAGLGNWQYEGRLDLVKSEGKWWIDWSPAAIHPELGAGQRLARTRSWPERAPILAHDGSVMVGLHEVVTVGVEPQRIEDRQLLLTSLEEELGIPPEDVITELERPGVQPDWFLPLVQLRPDRYEAVRPAIYDVPGTVFRRTMARTTPERDLATHVLGRTGEITAELLETADRQYVLGDEVGLSGLELVFERRLAGIPSGDVQAVDQAGTVVSVLHRFEGEPPEPLETTLDVEVQLAAEQALDGVDAPAGLVAVDPSTGGIRAAVSRPAEELNRALAGRYPPGSTFKIVTAAAALGAGIGASEELSCPESVTVGGKPFRNAGDRALGSLTLTQAFAESCNTVFAPLAVRVGGDALIAAGETFGFGTEYALPLPVGGGRFPPPADEAEVGAVGIGQGRVEASPLHMATVAAAVSDGTWRAPSLVADDRGGETRPIGPSVAGPLREMMRAVVEAGTGQSAAVAGRDVAGKTGTAEFDRGDPPPTHAWFVGFSGDLAVAVFVEGGGSGGEVAAPIASRFLGQLP